MGLQPMRSAVPSGQECLCRDLPMLSLTRVGKCVDNAEADFERMEKPI